MIYSNKELAVLKLDLCKELKKFGQIIQEKKSAEEINSLYSIVKEKIDTLSIIVINNPKN